MKFIEIRTLLNGEALDDLVCHSPNTLFVISGLPGSGKTRTRLRLADVSARFHNDPIFKGCSYELDEWIEPTVVGASTKWLIDDELVTAAALTCRSQRPALVSGTADNLGESIPFIAAAFDKTDVALIMISRDYESFFSTHRLRASVRTAPSEASQVLASLHRGDYYHRARKYRNILIHKVASVWESSMPSGSLSVYELEPAQETEVHGPRVWAV